MPALLHRPSLARLRRTLGAAACVTAPLRFLGRELRGGPSTGEYRLRGSGLRVAIRHPLLDMWVLEEIFRLRAYEPSAAVRDALRPLEHGGQILDLGGHIGCFGLFMHGRYPNASLTSFEPDPGNAQLLRRCVELNQLADRWTVIEACAARREGTARFASSFHLSRISAPGEQSLPQLQASLAGAFPFLRGSAMLKSQERQVPCRDAFPHLRHADLVKIDIEGGEWDLLADERLEQLQALAVVLEYHPAYAPGLDPDATVEQALARAGYEICQRQPGADGTVLWALRAQRATS